MRIYFHVVFYIIFSVELFAQPLHIVPNTGNDSNQLILTSLDSLYKLNPNTLDIDSSFKLSKPLPNSSKKYYAFNSDQGLLLVANGRGEIRFLRDSMNIRIDNSTLNNFSNAAVFKHRDTIFKFGGYGYWQASNNLIYFDKTSKEWEIYHISRGSELPPFSFDHTYFYNDEKLFILSGKLLDPFNAKDDKRVPMSFTFDFKTKQWTKIHTNNNYYSGYEYDYDKGSLLFQHDQIIFFDWDNNKKIIYNSNFVDDVDFSRGVSILNQFIFYFKRNENSIQKISLDDFFGQTIVSDKIFTQKSNSKTLIFATIFLFLIIIVLTNFFKKKNVITIDSNHLRFKNKFISITGRTHEVLCFIAENPSFQTNELYDFLYDSSLHPNHVYKIINYELKVIEDLFKVITGKNIPVFIKTKFEKDRRITLYKLQAEHYCLVNRTSKS